VRTPPRSVGVLYITDESVLMQGQAA
jgi:hypothetical protein